MSIETQLKSFFTEHWCYMAVATACQLNIFDAIAAKEKVTAAQLADELTLDTKATDLLIRALNANGFLELSGQCYELTELSEQLTEQHPKSLKYACMNWSGEHLSAWQSLGYSLKTGKAAFPEHFGAPFFAYLHQHPEKLANYHKAMFEYGRDDYSHLPGVFDFAQAASVIDIGGGYGAAIKRIKNQNKALRCALLDLPEVVEQIDHNDIELLSGDFFNDLPKGYQVQVLGRVLHDWDDEKALRILQNCYEALPENGSLLLMENCEDLIENDLSLLSLNMMLMCESHERTSTAYIQLAQKAGFHWFENRPLNPLQTLMIFKK